MEQSLKELVGYFPGWHHELKSDFAGCCCWRQCSWTQDLHAVAESVSEKFLAVCSFAEEYAVVAVAAAAAAAGRLECCQYQQDGLIARVARSC